MTVLRRLRAAWRSRDRRAGDAVVALLLLVLMVGELVAKHPQPGEGATTWVAYAWAAVVTLPIAIHRRYPEWAVPVAAAGVIGYSAGHYVAFPGYAAFALVFLVSLHTGRGRGVFAFAFLAVAVGVALSLQSAVTVTPSTWVSTMLALAVAWLAGENLRIRQSRWLALRERTSRLEAEREERARQAVTEERLRIARELHDVVAHSMSVIAVQAGVAHHVIDSRPELARAALATVETHTRAALVEMRRLLGVLRQADEPTGSLTPAPGLADVPGLVTQLNEVGLEVSVSVTGPATGIPDGVDLSAYRIVQEGLTNVLRHGGPQARIDICYLPGRIRIEIEDDGAPPGTHPRGEPGHGLTGMRERVAVFGGTLTAGPRPGGGFDLTATLPYAAEPGGTLTPPADLAPAASGRGETGPGAVTGAGARGETGPGVITAASGAGGSPAVGSEEPGRAVSVAGGEQ